MLHISGEGMGLFNLCLSLVNSFIMIVALYLIYRTVRLLQLLTRKMLDVKDSSENNNDMVSGICAEAGSTIREAHSAIQEDTTRGVGNKDSKEDHTDDRRDTNTNAPHKL